MMYVNRNIYMNTPAVTQRMCRYRGHPLHQQISRFEWFNPKIFFKKNQSIDSGRETAVSRCGICLLRCLHIYIYSKWDEPLKLQVLWICIFMFLYFDILLFCRIFRILPFNYTCLACFYKYLCIYIYIYILLNSLQL